MNMTEARVLAALAPGGQLTADRIADSADITLRAANRAIDRLAYLGLIVTGVGLWCDTWTLSRRGRAYIATSTGRALLDVPAGV
ncbi:MULTISPECIES: hypothetical protein [unclassified Nocardia]|uniref:hypothetical protein n=1 Tax=unclassified Nocardia TaxID=2637762 RepID=UPI00278C28D4|nr:MULTISPECIES: hypothetical protein [unclassified Nocardia]